MLETAVVQRRFLARSLVVLGQYFNNWTRLPCRCLVCGDAAELLPQHVFAGTSRCPTCERARLVEQYRTSPDKAVAVMLRGGWYPLVAYTNAKTRWPSRCLFCGAYEEPSKTDIQHREAGTACVGRDRHKRRS